MTLTQFKNIPESDREIIIEALKRILLEAQGEIVVPDSEYCLNQNPFDCNIVRGRMLKIVLDRGVVRVISFYSHTSTDCPECSPEEIEKLDRESEEVIYEIPLLSILP